MFQQAPAIAAPTDNPNASSIRWKENVTPIGDPLSKVVNLKGVEFDWKEEYGGKHDIGFIAEEVGKVAPILVEWEVDGESANGVRYDRVTALLVEAVKKQQEQLRRHDDQLADHYRRLCDLDSRVAALCSRVDEHETTLSRHQKRLIIHGKSIDSLSYDMEKVVEELDAMNERLDEVEQNTCECGAAAPATPAQ